MLGVCILYLGYLLVKSVKYMIMVIVITSFLGVNLIIRNVNYQKIDYGNINLQGVVTSVKEKSKSNQVIVRSNKLKYIFYDDKKTLKIGDYIEVSGNLTQGDTNHIPLLFNYQRYLKENNIKGIIKDITYEKIKTSVTIYTAHQKVLNYFNFHFKGQTRGFLKALLIGDKTSLGEELIEEISSVGIGHLFVISGLHMNVLQKIVEKLLKYLKVPSKFHITIIIVFFLLYFMITLYLVSILRVLLIYVLSKINKKASLNLTTLDIYTISITMILIVNPYYLMNYSFILTFIISTSLVVISPHLKYKKIKGFILNNIIMSINSILVTIPIIVHINPSINTLSIIYNLFYIPFVTYILLPFSLIVTIFNFLSPVYELIVTVFSKVTSFLSVVKIGELRLSTSSEIFPIIFYSLFLIIVILFLSNSKIKKKIVAGLTMASLIFIWSNSANLNLNDQIYFLDLPVGDSTLIVKAFNSANILIDTGENINNDLDLFLKKKGIKRLDFVIISHSDSDHNGRLHALIKDFKIKNIVISSYDTITEKICQDALYNGNIIKVKKGSSITYKNINFQVLSPSKKHTSPNNDSIVMKVNIFDKTILMTGDMEKEIENELLKEYKEIVVDIYKVPHHGSYTSSTTDFLNKLNYEYAVCMNGYRNTFGFPNNKVVTRYDQSKLLVTKDYTTIIFQKKWYQKQIKFKH
ncbi:MAG: DNA internalization-related competence protein ComEC/Rec2 [Mollicutes bacterium]|nr:DNA internalization-related competence protein ComEC/Rec2 [Mollicutes bacterium]